MFSHFKMELVKVFSKPQRRKADEGVRGGGLGLKCSLSCEGEDILQLESGGRDKI